MLLLIALSLSFKRINSSWIKRKKERKKEKKKTKKKKKHFVSMVSTWTKVSSCLETFHVLLCFGRDCGIVSVWDQCGRYLFPMLQIQTICSADAFEDTWFIFLVGCSSSAKKWDIWREKGYFWNGHEDFIGLPPLHQIRQPNSLEQLFHHVLPMRHLSKHCFHYLQLYYCHICETGN